MSFVPTALRRLACHAAGNNNGAAARAVRDPTAYRQKPGGDRRTTSATASLSWRRPGGVVAEDMRRLIGRAGTGHAS